MDEIDEKEILEEDQDEDIQEDEDYDSDAMKQSR